MLRTFRTELEAKDKGVCVVLPFDPNEAWGVKQRHYVTGSINGCPIRASIDGEAPPFSLALGPAWLRDNGIGAGENVEVVLAPEGPQSGTLSPDIAAALAAAPEARSFFDSIATFYRNNFVRWIESAKRPETRSARIAEMIRMLNAGQKQR